MCVYVYILQYAKVTIYGSARNYTLVCTRLQNQSVDKFTFMYVPIVFAYMATYTLSMHSNHPATCAQKQRRRVIFGVGKCPYLDNPNFENRLLERPID